MRELVKIKFGSHMYGTATPESDLDYKVVHIPDTKDILLQRCKEVISSSTGDKDGKNRAGDIDIESFSLHKFIKLVTQAQTVAIDMLFAPRSSMEFVTPQWDYIISHREHLLTNKYMSFVGYCRQQANKYGIKGSRVATVRDMISMLSGLSDKYGPKSKVIDCKDAFYDFCLQHEHTSITFDNDNYKNTVMTVCGKGIQWGNSLETALAIYQRLFKEYGQRALQAEVNENIDWKAMSHAVRIGQQAIELLTTGKVTFPRPNADYLLDIKRGKLDYSIVSGQIEDLLEKIEDTKSILPDNYNETATENIVLSLYGAEVKNEYI